MIYVSLTWFFHMTHLSLTWIFHMIHLLHTWFTWFICFQTWFFHMIHLFCTHNWYTPMFLLYNSYDHMTLSHDLLFACDFYSHDSFVWIVWFMRFSTHESLHFSSLFKMIYLFLRRFCYANDSLIFTCYFIHKMYLVIWLLMEIYSQLAKILR